MAQPAASAPSPLARARTLTRSIRFRLALWFVAILALILLGFSAFIYTRQAREIGLETTARLEAKASQLELYYRLNLRRSLERGNGAPASDLPDDVPLLQENEVLVLLGPRGRLLQKIGPLTDTELVDLLQAWQQSGADSASFTYQLSGAPRANAPSPDTTYQFVLAAVPVANEWRGGLILGSPIDPGSQMPRLFLTLALGCLAILSVAFVGGYWLAGRAMRPVQMITRTARAISETDLNRRLKLGGRDELGELADTFDQMLDRLQAAFERQRQFTADASHELRTPLTIIELEASRALEHPRAPEEYERALSTIKSENELMTRIVNDLLSLARMDAGQAIVKTEKLDLSDVALEVVERLATLARQKGVELAAGDLPEVSIRGDRQLLVQMLSNLVENAIKHGASADGREIRVLVETGLEPAGGRPSNRGWVRVQDNGPGIPAEHIPRLFDRFHRVDQARQRSENGASGEFETGGIGLGLSIVQWIAQIHGGHIEVRSELGQGSTFQVWLPVDKKSPA